MGVLLGSIALIIAAGCIAFGIKTGKVPVPGFAWVLPGFVDRKVNPGGFLTCMFGWVLAAFAALLLIIFSAL